MSQAATRRLSHDIIEAALDVKMPGWKSLPGHPERKGSANRFAESRDRSSQPAAEDLPRRAGLHNV